MARWRHTRRAVLSTVGTGLAGLADPPGRRGSARTDATETPPPGCPPTDLTGGWEFDVPIGPTTVRTAVSADDDDGNGVYLATVRSTGDGPETTLYALTGGGRRDWSTTVAGEATELVVGTGTRSETVYLATKRRDGPVASAFAGTDGTRRWERSLSGPTPNAGSRTDIGPNPLGLTPPDPMTAATTGGGLTTPDGRFVADTKAVYLQRSNEVTAVTPDGTDRWTFPTGRTVAGPVRPPGTDVALVAGDGDGDGDGVDVSGPEPFVSAVGRATGDRRWTTPFPDAASLDLLGAANGTALVGAVPPTPDGKSTLTALSLGSGRRRWTLRGRPGERFVGGPGPGPDGSTTVVGFDATAWKRTLYSVDVETGDREWTWRPSTGVETFRVVPGADRAIAVGFREVLGFDIDRGQPAWRRPVGPVLTGVGVTDDDRVVAVSTEDTTTVTALEPGTGGVAWRTTVDGRHRPKNGTFLVACASAFLVVTRENATDRLHTLSTADGSTVSTYAPPARDVRSVTVDGAGLRVVSTPACAVDTRDGAGRVTARLSVFSGPEPSLSPEVAQFDADGNGEIEATEALDAVVAYNQGRIDAGTVLDVIVAYND
jgi:hypothetical protein